MPVSQAPPLRARSLPNSAPVAVSIPPPSQGTTAGAAVLAHDNRVTAPTKTGATSAWELIAASQTPDDIELDQIPFTDDGAILSDDLPQAPPPPAPKEAAPVAEEKELPMNSQRAFGLDPHPKTDQARIKDAARVYEEERVISNAPRPEPIKPTWEQAAPVKPKFDALKDAEIAEILD